MSFVMVFAGDGLGDGNGHGNGDGGGMAWDGMVLQMGWHGL